MINNYTERHERTRCPKLQCKILPTIYSAPKNFQRLFYMPGSNELRRRFIQLLSSLMMAYLGRNM